MHLLQSLSAKPAAFSLKRRAWNPYAVGAGIGVLSWLAFLLVNKPIGMSTEIPNSHAAMGFIGMLAGGIAYASTYAWVDEKILSVWTLGKVRLPDITGIPTGIWWLLFAVLVPVVFFFLERFSRRPVPTT